MYPNFYRIQSGAKQLESWISLARVMKWHTVSIITDVNPVNVGIVKGTMKAFQELNISIATLQFFDKDPGEAIARIAQSKARVIYATCYHDTCPKIVCEAYLQKLYGSRIIWVFSDQLALESTDFKEGCTLEKLKVLDIGTFYRFQRIEKPPVYLGLTDEIFEKMLSERITNYSTNTFRQYRPMCFDSFAPGVYILDNVEKHLKSQGKTLRQMIGETSQKAELLAIVGNVMDRMDIQLFAGRVKYRFGRHETILASGYEQTMKNGTKVPVFFDNGAHLPDDERFEFLAPMQWSTPDGKPPALEPTTITKLITVDRIFAEIIIVIAIGTMVVFGNILIKEIRRKSLRIMFKIYLMLLPIGIILLLLTILFYGRVDTLLFCKVAPALIAIGLTLISSSIFVAMNSNMNSINREDCDPKCTSIGAPVATALKKNDRSMVTMRNKFQSSPRLPKSAKVRPNTPQFVPYANLEGSPKIVKRTKLAPRSGVDTPSPFVRKKNAAAKSPNVRSRFNHGWQSAEIPILPTAQIALFITASSFVVVSLACFISWYAVGGMPSTITKSSSSYDAISDHLTIEKWENCSGNSNPFNFPLAIAVLTIEFFATIYNFMVSIQFKGFKCHPDKQKSIFYSYIFFPVTLFAIFVVVGVQQLYVIFYILAPVLILVSWGLIIIYFDVFNFISLDYNV